MNALALVADLPHPGAAIRERRIELGWTQAKLAAEADVTQADISRIESGELDARWSTIRRLSVALASPEPARRSLANGNRRSRKPLEGRAWTPTGSELPVEPA